MTSIIQTGVGRAGRAAIVVAAAALLMTVAPATPALAGAGPSVSPPHAHAFGKTYGEWSAAQWAWELTAQELPGSPIVDQHPGTAAQPEAVDCSIGNAGHVWFLAGTTYAQPYSTAYRSCSIPSGTALFFPVIDAWGDNLSCPGQPNGTLTADELSGLLKQQTDNIVPGSLSVTIDGTSVPGLADANTAFRAQATGFTYVLPVNNALSRLCPTPFPPGTSPPAPGAFADGVYILIPPLPVGTHHLTWAGAESGGPLGAFTQNLSYTIDVTPGHH